MTSVIFYFFSAQGKIFKYLLFYCSIFSRVGEDADAEKVGNKTPEVNKTGTVDNAKGVYSSSSSKVDDKGKGTYHVEAGKINWFYKLIN